MELTEQQLERAQLVTDMEREEAIAVARAPQEQERKRLIDMENEGLPNNCRYCGEPVTGYTSAFCQPEDDWSCSREYSREREAMKRNGGV